MSNIPDSTVAREDSIGRMLGGIGVIFVLLSAALGLLGLQSLSSSWALLALGMHFAPAVMQFLRSLRLFGRWVAVFLVAQAAVSVAVLDAQGLPPNISRQFVVQSSSIPGISGVKTLTTDGMGFRVTRAVNYAGKAPGTIRLFALGGSTTEQQLLDDRETWTHLLQESLQAVWLTAQVEVVNAGASGTRAVNHLEKLREVGRYQPDFVLILVGINDWNKDIRERFGSQAYGHLATLLWDLRLENTLLGQALRVASYRLGGAGLGRASQALGGQMRGQTSSLDRGDRRKLTIGQVGRDYAKTLADIADECTRLRVRCVFLTQPHAYLEGAPVELRRRFWMTPPFEDYTLDEPSLRSIADTYNRHLVEELRARGQSVCDVAAAFSDRFDVFYDDCHFNEAGARAAAAAIAECILALGEPSSTPVR